MGIYTQAVVAGTLTAVIAGMAGLGGCSRAETATLPQAPPAVTVARVVERSITDFAEFTGHFEAVQRVEIRPRVSGYISSVDFVQGHEVRQGDTLFVIDPRPYEAAYRQARAQLAQAQSQYDLAVSERTRAENLQASHAVSREELESRVAAAEQASATVQADQASLEEARLNLSFTRVTAPISGVVGRAEVTAGNLVNPGQTLLTTLVSVDPIYVSFEGDEQGYLDFMHFTRSGGPDSAAHPVFVGLVNEEGYPHQGSIVFVNNEIDPATGTMRARGLLENHDRRFTPGMFARVKLPGSTPHEALLINDSAIGTDQSVKYVLRLGKDNAIEYRTVKLGPLVDGLRVVTAGLSPNDSIVVNGLQRVRPGMVVTPERVAMGEQHTGDRESGDHGLVARNGR
ncbi:MAG TPA: efflux RND transporter periplasmic adaptor subunit [Steroidobacteraceae bacterium]|nr:efflux RND transporter periplasmic adaptor subunit [Steroidobacteraceae bacterium]